MKNSSTERHAGLQPESFDHREFLARTNQDMELVVDLIELFLHAHPASMDRIADALASGNGEAIRNAVHQFKGALKFIHAGPAVAAAQRLEQVGRDRRMDLADETFDLLSQEIRRLLPALQSFLDQSRR